MTVLKSIVVCLVLANIGYFLFLHGIAPAPTVPATAAPETILKLASEVPVAQPAAAGGSEAGSAGPAPAVEDGIPALPASVKRCISVGPFKEVSEAAHAAGTLRSGGYEPRQRVVDGDVWAGVWVYVPIPGTHPASDQMLATLKAAGIDDSQRLPGPEGQVVSLGLFSEQKRAQARVAQLRALGLSPGVADRKRSGTLYWIDLDLQPTDGVPNPADLQGQAGHINRLEVRACPAPVAPPAATAAASAASAA